MSIFSIFSSSTETGMQLVLNKYLCGTDICIIPPFRITERCFLLFHYGAIAGSLIARLGFSGLESSLAHYESVNGDKTPIIIIAMYLVLTVINSVLTACQALHDLTCNPHQKCSKLYSIFRFEDCYEPHVAPFCL